MTIRRYLVPAFFDIHATSLAEANKLAGDIQGAIVKMGQALYLDEELPTIQVDEDLEIHTVLGNPD